MCDERHFYRWNNVTDFFAALNLEHCRYVVMRNYESMHTPNFFCEKHEDIDLLVDDVEKFERTAHAYRKMWPEDDAHFVVFIDNTAVPIDVRHVGDMYYDEKWMREILDRRKMASNGNWYVMDEEDYYYSLAYHAILQKKYVSEEYISRLNSMAEGLSIDASCKENHIKRLELFLDAHQYRFTIPKDCSVPLYLDNRRVRMVSRVKDYLESVRWSIYGTRLWGKLRQLKYNYWKKQLAKGHGYFHDIKKYCLKIDKLFGEDVYDQLAEARLYRYVGRFEDEAQKQYQELKDTITSRKKDNQKDALFTMWQQGIEEAPLVIKACVSSIEKLAEKKDKDFVILDENNIDNYIDMPEFIQEKHNAGIIGRAHYSDLIRLYVLAVYGGTWIDSSVFIPEDVPNYMLDDFFVFTQSSQLREKRKHANWWISAKPKNEVILRTLAYLLVWWKNEDEAFHYYIFHVIWHKVITEYADCKRLINNIPIVITDTTHTLLKSFAKEYSENDWKIMKQNSPVFKCSYKVKGYNTLSTYYCKLCEGELK